MRRIGLAGAVALVLIAIGLFRIDWPGLRQVPNTLPAGTLNSERKGTRESGPKREFTPANSRPVEHSVQGVLLLPDAEALARRLHGAEATAEEDMEILQRLFESFRSANGGMNPAGGLNEEIMDGLRGKNPKRVAAFPPNHSSIDAQGRLLDRWSTPYFFHPISSKVLEVRSAGPDRKLWTEDDIEGAKAER